MKDCSDTAVVVFVERSTKPLNGEAFKPFKLSSDPLFPYFYNNCDPAYAICKKKILI